jgi:plasmanylethanolamine desaturase
MPSTVRRSSPSSGSGTYSYSAGHRLLEMVAMVAAFAMLVVTLYAAVRGLPSDSGWKAALFLFGGLCLADFFSGLVHWAADTYGSPTMPIFGGFVRTFREHHADQHDITRHDTIETNGDVCIFSSPVHLVFLLWVENPFGLLTLFGVFLGSYTNSQIHKWAHMAKPPALVRVIQRSRLFLSPTHHAHHHSGAHLTNYCITTGWMNGLLDQLRFFRAVEWVLLRIGLKRTT